MIIFLVAMKVFDFTQTFEIFQVNSYYSLRPTTYGLAPFLARQIVWMKLLIEDIFMWTDQDVLLLLLLVVMFLLLLTLTIFRRFT